MSAMKSAFKMVEKNHSMVFRRNPSGPLVVAANGVVKIKRDS